VLLAKFYRDRKKFSELTSVISNLNYMLNTKKGFGFWREGYGVGDYNEYKARNKIVQTLIAEIKENIETYEPRVRLDDIQEVPSDSPFRLRFQMRGTFLDDDRPVFIVVDALRNLVTIEGSG
jgi:type VI secretion system protein